MCWTPLENTSQDPYHQDMPSSSHTKQRWLDPRNIHGWTHCFQRESPHSKTAPQPTSLTGVRTRLMGQSWGQWTFVRMFISLSNVWKCQTTSLEKHTSSWNSRKRGWRMTGCLAEPGTQRPQPTTEHQTQAGLLCRCEFLLETGRFPARLTIKIKPKSPSTNT